MTAPLGEPASSAASEGYGDGTATSKSWDLPGAQVPETSERAAEAIRLGALGYAVVRVYPVRDGVCTCDDGASCRTPGKHPIGGDRKATSDQNILRRWWAERPDANVGISLALSGVVDVAPDSTGAVVDFNQRGLPPTAT